MMHKPTPPTLNEHGDETHPAFGAITAHRVTSNPGVVLFDSEITHRQFIRVTISGMKRQRDLNRDWLFEDSKPYIEVDMSEAQWASFVSSMNTTAVPCTVRRTESEWDVPGLEFAPRLALSAQETVTAAEKAFARIKEAVDALDVALSQKSTAKEKREALRQVRLAVEGAPHNVKFASDSLTEHVENVVQKARADVEGMVVAHAKQLGIDPGEVQFVALEAAPPQAED